MSKVNGSSIHIINTGREGELQVKAEPSLNELILQAAIERLRVSKREVVQFAVNQGEKDGARWARDEASYSHLCELEKLNPSDPTDLEYGLYMAARSMSQGQKEDQNYLHGFLKGIQMFFARVKGQI